MHEEEVTQKNTRDSSAVHSEVNAPMRTYYIGAAVLAIVIFGILYFFTGAMGETRIGIAIKTNPILNLGLVAHYTFDTKSTGIDATGGDALWSTTTDPGSGNDIAYGIATDSSGDVYVTGYCGSGCGTLAAYYTTKIDGSNGNALWSTTTDPGSGNDYARAIATDSSGDVYVTGYCGSGCGTLAAYYTTKIDGSNGNALWSTTTDPGSGNDYARAIATDSSGNVYVTGYCGSGCGTGIAYYTTKIDGSNGNALWSTTTDPGSGTDIAYGIATDSSGDVYVTGYCGSGCGTGVVYYTMKIDGSNGNALWSTTTDPSSGSDYAYAIATDSSGNVYVTGECASGCGTGIAYYTTKIDGSNGNALWSTTTDPGSGNDIAYGIATDSSGDVYVTGECDGCVVLNSSYYIMKIDGSNGNALWSTSTDPGLGSDIARAIATDSSGDVYVTGECASGCGTGYAYYTMKIVSSDDTAGDIVTTAEERPGKIGQGLYFNGWDSAHLGNIGSNIKSVAFWVRSQDATQNIMNLSSSTVTTIEYATTTMYFDTYDTVTEKWGTTPANMTDGNTGNYASESVDTTVQLLTGNTESATTTGAYPVNVKMRVFGYQQDNVTNYSATTTYYFNAYDSGVEEWSTNPAQMVDNNTSNYAFSQTDGDVQLLTGSTVTATTTDAAPTNIIIRAYGYEDAGDNGTLSIRPVFTGGDGTTNNFTLGDGVANAAWTADTNITNDTNAPGTWTWTDLVNLDADIVSNKGTGAPDGQNVSIVELEVGYDYSESAPPENLGLRPVFSGGDGTTNNIALPVGVGNAAWSSYYNITEDTNAPSTWTWTDIVNLDADVVNGNNTMYVSKVEVDIGYATTTVVGDPGIRIHSDASNASSTGVISPTIYTNGTVGTALPADNDWHHVVITSGSSIDIDAAILGYGFIYEGETFVPGYLSGYLDDVRFYDRELNAEDVKRLYGLGATTKIQKTLNTNKALEIGLVTHSSFDSSLSYTYSYAGLDPGDLLWATTTDPTASNEMGRAIATDSSGNAYVTGSANNNHYTYKINGSTGAMIWATTTSPSVAFENPRGIATDSSGNVYVTATCGSACGGDGHYTYKINGSTGAMIWATTTNPSTTGDEPRAIATDSSGDVYVTSSCGNCVTADVSYYTYKIDGSNGDMLWATTTNPSNGNDQAYGIAVDSSGDVYVTGTCSGCYTLDQSHYTFKIDGSNRDMVWATTTNPSITTDIASAIATDSSGDVFVTGSCITGCGEVGAGAYYTYKIDGSNGDMLWATTTDLSSATESGNGIATDSSGDVYVTGTCDSGCGTGGAYYIFKIDGSNGDMLWATTNDPSSGDDWGNAIAVDSGGNVFVTGKTDDEKCGGSGTDSCHHTIKLAGVASAGDPVAAPGKIGQSMYFDGAGGYIEEGNIGPLNSLTFWVKRENEGEEGLFSVGDSEVVEINASNQIVAKEWPAATIYVDGVVGDMIIDDTAWHHVTITDATGVDGSRFDIGGAGTTTGWSDPGTVVSDGSFGDYSWSLPEEAKISDNDWTSVYFDDEGDSNYLKATNFGFSIPTTPAGIEISYEAQSSDDCFDSRVRLVDEVGTIGSTDNNQGEYLPGYDAVFFRGGSTDLWDSAWSVTDINDSDFGFVVAFYCVIDVDLELDDLSMRIHLQPALFKGHIDDVRTYNRVLTQNEITRLYELGATTKVNKTITTNPDLKRGLVGHWTLDGPDIDTRSPAAEIIDRSGNGNTLNWLNHATTTAPGKIGQAIAFDGVDDRLYMPSITPLSGDFTFSAWVNGNNIPDMVDETIIGQYRERNFYMTWDGGTHAKTSFGYVPCGGGNTQLSYGDVEARTWIHLVGVWDGTDLIVYKDGVEYASNTTGSTPCTSEAAHFFVGEGTYSDTSFEGKIDDVRVYDRALSAEEITRLYELGN